MKTRLHAIILICAAVVSFALCGCSKPKTKPGMIELKMTLWDKQEDLEFYARALKEFYKEHPNIRVTIEATPWVRMFDKLLVSTAGGRSPT